MCFTPHKIFKSDQIKNTEMGRECSMCGGKEKCIQGFFWNNLRDGDNFEVPGLDWRPILKWIFEKSVGRSWAGSIWLRIETGRALLSVRWGSFWFHKMKGISLLDSQEGLCSMK
jgi:hypothetical protein